METGRAGDAEGAQVAAVLLVGFSVVIFRHEGHGGDVHVEGVDVVLGEESHAQARVLADEAL